MTPERNKTLVRRFYEEVVNTGNTDLLDSLLAPDYCEVLDGTRHAVGIEGAKAHIVGVRQTYPDLHITIDQQIAEGEWGVSCITARGTHKGTWLGMKPTGKHVVFTGVNVDRVIAGRIVEHGGAANLLGPLLAIGAIKVVGDDD
jgi:predicted ester cyclase